MKKTDLQGLSNAAKQLLNKIDVKKEPPIPQPLQRDKKYAGVSEFIAESGPDVRIPGFGDMAIYSSFFL